MIPSRISYLDWNATAPVRPEAIEAMTAALRRCGNPSSVHRAGRDGRRALEEARTAVAALCGATPDEVIFTSGGTEANHQALRGLPGRWPILSAIEHESVRAAAPDAVVLPVARDGVADLAALDRLLAEASRPALVSLMLANNETGAIQPIAEAARIARSCGALLHCDAIQAAGKLPLDCRDLGADLLTLSAHKIGGPQGVGALIVSPELRLTPLLSGGGQERNRRAGTENLPGIIGFGVAARLAAAEIESCRLIATLRDEAQSRLLAIAPEAQVFAAAVSRLPNTLCIAMPGVAAATQVMALDLAGVLVSAGAACSSGKLQRSHVLEAMGVPPTEADSAIRISFGRSSTAADVDHLVEAWGALYTRKRAEAA